MPKTQTYNRHIEKYDGYEELRSPIGYGRSATNRHETFPLIFTPGNQVRQQISPRRKGSVQPLMLPRDAAYHATKARGDDRASEMRPAKARSIPSPMTTNFC